VSGGATGSPVQGVSSFDANLRSFISPPSHDSNELRVSPAAGRVPLLGRDRVLSAVDALTEQQYTQPTGTACVDSRYTQSHLLRRVDLVFPMEWRVADIIPDG
jgi:hypothetical protein